MSIVIGEFYNNLDYEETTETLYESVMETAMPAKKRNNLDSDKFGLPSKRKYPLNDKKHVQAAIRMFNHVENDDEEELADNILSAMKKYKISFDSVGDNNRLKKYIKEDVITEGLLINMPKDAQTLRDKLKENIKEIRDRDKKKDNSILGTIKNSSTMSDQDAQEEELKMALVAVKKTPCTILDVSIDPVIYANAIVAHSYHIYVYYKKYVACITISGSKGVLNPLPYVELIYDSSKCEIPKDVVTTVIGTMKSNINKITVTRKQFKIKSNTRTIDRAYGILYNKYKNKYTVKKTANAIIVSTIKLHESCASVPPAVVSPFSTDGSIYIMKYTDKNTKEEDTAICRGNMTDLYIYDDEPKKVSIKEFRDIADNIKMYRYFTEVNYKSIIEASYCSDDFYKNLHGEGPIEHNPYFEKVNSFVDELAAIEECTKATIRPVTVLERSTILPVYEVDQDFANVKFYRNISGVFAMSENTGYRSDYYDSYKQISESVINYLSSL